MPNLCPSFHGAVRVPNATREVLMAQFGDETTPLPGLRHHELT